MTVVRRHSQKRDRIYEYIKGTCCHPTADMIYQELRPEIPNLSLGTVYRNLKQLEEDGKIRKVTVLQNSERYEAVMHDHAHFVCRECQKVMDCDDLNIEQIAKVFPLPDGYTAESFSLTITGLCDECRRKQTA